MDDAIIPAVTSAAHGLTGFSASTAITHFHQQVDDQLLKKAGVHLFNLF